MQKWQRPATTEHNLSDAPPISESMLDDEQIENALIRTIWENAIELPESVAVSTTIKNTEFSLSVLLSNIETLYSAVAEENGLDFTINLGNEIDGFFIGDQAKIGRILRSLVNNAIFHTDKGSVNITCIHRNDLLTVSISDTGAGISKDTIHSLSHTSPEGDAIIENLLQDKGLTMTKTLCEILGGQLTIRSEEQIGSVVTVSIPLRKAPFEPDELSPGETMIRRWRQKYGNNVELESVFFRSLEFMKQEIEELEHMLEDDKRHEISRMLHTMRGFPGGFGLTEIHEKIKTIEQSAHHKPYDRNRIAEHLADLKQFLFSIPDQPFLMESNASSTTNELDSELTSLLGINKTVLIADDDRMNGEMIEYLLKRMGAEYRIVRNGEEVLQQLSEKTFDLLLLDIRMPVMGGIETIIRIRNERKLDGLYIIAMTANDLPGGEAEFKNIGYNDFVSKPIDLNLLTSKIKTALDRNT